MANNSGSLRQLKLLNHLQNFANNPTPKPTGNPVPLVCFLCQSSNVPQPKVQPNRSSRIRKPIIQQKTPISKRTESQCTTLCGLFQLQFNDMDDTLKTILSEATYCQDCEKLVSDIEFVVSSIKALEEKLLFLRTKVENWIDLASPVIKLEEVEPLLVKLEEEELSPDPDPTNLIEDDFDESSDDDEYEGEETTNTMDDIDPFIEDTSKTTEEKYFPIPEIDPMLINDNDNAETSSESKPQLARSRKQTLTKLDDPNLREYQVPKTIGSKASQWNPTDFTCLLCKRKLAKRSGLRAHYLRMHMEKELEDLDIAILNTIHPEVIRLISTTLPPKPKKEVKCTEPGCGAKFRKKEPLEAHHLRVHLKAEPQFQCLLCQSRYFISRHLKNHYSHTHKPQDLENESAKEIEFPPGIRKLIMNPPLHERTEKVPCPQCGKVVRNLKQHCLFIHSENSSKPRCSLCGKIFSTSNEELDLHEQLHKSSNHLWNCVLCPDSSLSIFQLKSQLEKHVLENHEEEDNLFRCSQCSVFVLTQARLNAHIQTHHTVQGKSQYICNICGQSTMGPSFLRLHMMSHNNPTIKCDVEGCDLTFKSELLLKRHKMIRHADSSVPAPFKCSVCVKGFRRKCALKRHSLYHLELRPHMCHKCPGTFKAQRDLRTHLKLHEKEGFVARRGKRSRLKSGQLNREDFI